MPVQKLKINNITVKPIQSNTLPPEKIRGYELFEHLYPNIFLPAMTGSGKTSLIFEIIKRKCNKNTKIIGFIGTYQQDDSWINIIKWMEENDIQHEFYYSIHENNALENLILELKEHRKLEEEAKIKMKEKEEEKYKEVILKFNDDDTVEVKVKKPKKIAPKFCIIFDDLARELRSDLISFLSREIRHYKSMGIYSSQVLNDVNPGALAQMLYILILKGMNMLKLEELYTKLNLPISYENFKLLCEDATQEKYNFLYINVDGLFRKNFDQKYVIT